LGLDLLLIGYMTTQPITPSTAHPLLFKEDFDEQATFGYPEYQWGAHMYVLSRDGAKRLLDKFENGDYATASLLDPEKAFSPDWTITKLPETGENGRGRRALLYPMIAVEDGSDGIEHYGHQGQLDFHEATFEFNTRGRVFL
jgi:GR25 family glycosyltransferase involved in LPS biosynthesis